jgi:antitoxin component of MazEF toxin-antitoxin module
MTAITTKLIQDGNSKAVRLPKALLTLSGLHGSVQLEAKKGQIIIKQAQKFPRAGWKEQIEIVLREESHIKDDDFADLDATSSDGLDDVIWDGPSYEEWLKQHADD